MNKAISSELVIKEGLTVLHAAAMRGHAYIRKGRKGNLIWMRREAYLEMLGEIAALVDMKKILEQPPELVEAEIFKVLLSSYVVSGTKAASTFAIRDGSSLNELIEVFNRSSRLNRGLSVNAENLPVVAMRGLDLIHFTSLASVPVEDVIWGLALIGQSSISLRRTQKCEFCPRRSRVGGRFCAGHSQSDPSTYGRTVSNQYMNYRAGKKAYELGLKSDQKWILPLQKKAVEDDLSHLVLMTEILTKVYGESLDDRLPILRMALKKAPKVVALLGSKKIFHLGYKKLLDLLLIQLNPYVADETLLEYVIFDFEAWLQLEELARPGKRSKGNETALKIEKAIHMAKIGMRRIAIARELHVARSTVSSWAKQHKMFREALSK